MRNRHRIPVIALFTALGALLCGCPHGTETCSEAVPESRCMNNTVQIGACGHFDTFADCARTTFPDGEPSSCCFAPPREGRRGVHACLRASFCREQAERSSRP